MFFLLPSNYVIHIYPHVKQKISQFEASEEGEQGDVLPTRVNVIMGNSEKRRTRGYKKRNIKVISNTNLNMFIANHWFGDGNHMQLTNTC